MDQIRQKMTALRTQQEDTEKENQQLKEKIKKLEQKEIDHEHDIKSVHLENTKLAALLEKTEKEVEQHKAAAEESGDFRQRHDMLQSRFQILDDESVASDNTIKDLKIQLNDLSRTIENLQRENGVLKAANTEGEKKADALDENLKKVTKELEDFQLEIGSI